MVRKFFKKKLIRNFLVFFLVLSWLFSGWPLIWSNPRIPPKPQEVQALNKANNGGFANALGTEWSVTDGANTATQNAYARVADASSQDGDGYVFNGKWTGTGNNSTWSAHCLWQTFTPTANVKAKLKGYYKRSIASKNDINTVKLELLTGVTSCTDGSVVATAFSDTQSNPGSAITDANWTSAPSSGTWTSDVSLTSGTTYYVRIFFQGQADSGEYGDTKIDNVQLNVAPTGLTVSAPAETTNAGLSWNISVGGTGASSLHATAPYQVYRDTVSPLTSTDFLANSSTNSYTDTTSTGNTTYYFAVTDLDTAGITSPMSSEALILTRPGAPTDVGFIGIGQTGMSVGWTAPAGGANNNYKVERAPDVSGSPGSFVEQASGVTSPWTDSSLSCGTVYWYRIRGSNATGNGAYSGNASQTTKNCVSISLTTDGLVNFNYLALGTSANTYDQSHPETVSVDQGPANLNIRSTIFNQGGNNWTLGDTNGDNRVKWEFSKDGSSWTTFSLPDPTSYTLDTNVGQSETRNIYFKITMPTLTNSYEQYGVTMTIMASAP